MSSGNDIHIREREKKKSLFCANFGSAWLGMVRHGSAWNEEPPKPHLLVASSNIIDNESSYKIPSHPISVQRCSWKSRWMDGWLDRFNQARLDGWLSQTPPQPHHGDIIPTKLPSIYTLTCNSIRSIDWYEYSPLARLLACSDHKRGYHQLYSYSSCLFIFIS